MFAMVSSDVNPVKNQENQESAQAGSAIIWVFIVIALFGMLTFMMSQGSRTGGQNIDRETADLAAGEILNYARTVKSAIQRLRINGCDEADISFANLDYNNAAHIPNPGTAPSDESCHVFESNGGNIRYENFDAVRVITDTKQAIFVTLNIEGIGTTADDLVMVLDSVAETACKKINQQMNNTDMAYVGDFGALLETGEDLTAANCADCIRKTAGCAYDTGNNNYNFYYVLIAQ